MLKTLFFKSKEQTADELIAALNAPPVPDPFVELLKKFTDKTGRVIVTARLEGRRHRRLGRLLKAWDKGLPVEGMIATEFGFPDELDVES